MKSYFSNKIKNKIADNKYSGNLLTLHELNFFENLRARGSSRLAVKKETLSPKMFVHFT